MKPRAWLFRTKVTKQANVFNAAEMVDHLDHSSNRNGESFKVQPKFKCLKIAFHYSGLTSIFKTACCRDSENPEDLVYQLSVTWKHDVTWRQRNAERNWYVTSYQTLPGPTAFSDFPKPWEGCQSPRSDRCSSLSQDRSWSHPWPSRQTLMRNEPAMGFTGTNGISQPSKPPALQPAKPGTPVLTLWDTALTECQTSKVNTKHIHSLTSTFSYKTWAPDMYRFSSWPLSHSDIPLVRSIA